MRIFREDPYKVYRAVYAVIGFSVVAFPITLFVQHFTPGLRDYVILLGFSVALPVLLVASYRREYLAVDGDDLLVTHLVSRDRLPIKSIIFLSYEFRGRALMLFVNYQLGAATKWASFVVDYITTADIKALHEELLAVNPAIEIRIDKWSADQQKRNEKNLRMVPTTRLGWVKFATKWFCIGAAFELLLFLLFVQKH